MGDFSTYVSLFFVLNILFAITIIFLERKNPTATWAWIMVLLLLPNVGFVLYLLFSQNLSKKRIFKLRKEEDELINTFRDEEVSLLTNNEIRFKDQSMTQYQDMIYMNLINSNAFFTQDNEIDIFTDGNIKFDQLIKSIEDAKDHVHMLYYIIKNDSISRRIINALIKKAQNGVEVRLLYDEVGSRSISKKLLRELKKAGGKAVPFFPSRIPFINFRINYRNHRKLVIIDGKHGFIGGFNIGDEYLGLDKKMGYWRDTHLKIKGNAVQSIQLRFLLDWRHAARETLDNLDKYFVDVKNPGDSGVQIVSSGPDSEQEQIKYGYIKMINSAKESIYIQTPYFIPDDSLLEALKIAALSGVDVRIMIPNKPDHIFVYWATYSYIGELLKAGARAYIYDKGFLHAKTFVMDGKIASVGTANVDVRSFRLNFEVNAFIYDSAVASELKNVFEKDIEDCKEITREIYSNRSNVIKIKESISRLLSPIL
ncbi:cardiolipin synthase [Wukongibacter baidiensis]|uniref:cardiolipin synthase n=1 Tax=Wukongibacter baidiensis TaxID=1723361 RepID=UPI003D7F5318